MYEGFLNSVDGDFNGDGNWNCADIDALVAEIVAGTNNPAFDMNGDGVVSASDITDGHKFQTSGGLSAVPEPAGWFLALFCLMAAYRPLVRAKCQR